MPRVHLLSFFTEGPPNDLGQDVRNGATRLRDAGTPFFDEIRFETPRTLTERDKTWVESFHNFVPEILASPEYRQDLKWNHGWALTGLFRWKPRLILEYLLSNKTNWGDIVFYHDSDALKYPEYLDGISLWPEFLKSQLRKTDVLLFRDNRARLVTDTKPELWEQFFDERFASSLKHVWGGAVAVKKTKKSIVFLERWNQFAQNPANILPFSRANSRDDFVVHAADQSILSCLWHESQSSWRTRRSVKCVYLNDSRRIPPAM